MVNQNATEARLVGVGLALIAGTLGQPAAAQTSNTNCYRVGNSVNCQTMTTAVQRPSGGLNIDWNAGQDEANLIGQLPQAAQQGALAGYQLGQMAAIRSALRGVDINNRDSVSRAVGALVKAGAFDQARQLMVLHNSLMARNAEAAMAPAPPSQIAESQPSAGVALADAPLPRQIPTPEFRPQTTHTQPASATPPQAAPPSASGYWLPGMPLPPQFRQPVGNQ